MKRTRKKYACTTVPPVTAREFIRVWQTSNSVAEVAMNIRRKKNAVRVRAFRYREMGIPLKQFQPVEVELPDWDELADYAASLTPEHDDLFNGQHPNGELPVDNTTASRQ